jgi:hypothetical protein
VQTFVPFSGIAVRTWRGSTPGLVGCGVAMSDEWVGPRRADAVRATLLESSDGVQPDLAGPARCGELPPWIGGDVMHARCRGW